jgi:ribosomal protein L7Ae-like RNA K-turn-binding protein
VNNKHKLVKAGTCEVLVDILRGAAMHNVIVAENVSKSN